ncbi:conserved hypothetical protein [Trichinella spiralis]|uniref:hypothetical protein n=1 Tax=Trichinella spiralis TaxID=6334 RepID=UPI0001EFC9FE|nr:conserved hypothetical protein [Trichinella spiralis]
MQNQYNIQSHEHILLITTSLSSCESGDALLLGKRIKANCFPSNALLSSRQCKTSEPTKCYCPTTNLTCLSITDGELSLSILHPEKEVSAIHALIRLFSKNITDDR